MPKVNDSCNRIIGIDPGSLVTGWGIIDSSYYGRRLDLVSSGIISVKKEAFPYNLRLIFDGLKNVMEEYNPKIMALEAVFSGHNSKSLIKLSQARGVICLLSGILGIELKEYAPRYVKKSVTGYGAAGKEQVKYMACEFLKDLKGKPLDDNISDALSVAISCATDMNNYLN